MERIFSGKKPFGHIFPKKIANLSDYEKIQLFPSQNRFWLFKKSQKSISSFFSDTEGTLLDFERKNIDWVVKTAIDLSRETFREKTSLFIGTLIVERFVANFAKKLSDCQRDLFVKTAEETIHQGVKKEEKCSNSVWVS